MAGAGDWPNVVAAPYQFFPYNNNYHQNAIRTRPGALVADARRTAAHTSHPYAQHVPARVPPTDNAVPVKFFPTPPLMKPRREFVRTLHLESEVECHKICVTWTPPVSWRGNFRYLITMKCTAANCTSQGTDNLEGGMEWYFDADWTQRTKEFKVTPGNHYSILVECRENGLRNTSLARGTIDVKASFSKLEHAILFDKATYFAGPQKQEFSILYRCKPQYYWDFLQLRGGIMKKYIKDNNGQPGNKINGNIHGLFFSARLNADGTLPNSSPFGDVRMMVPAGLLLDPERHNFYFADFYCNKLLHYVTIVVCVKGSDTDRFCNDNLLSFRIHDNPFLQIVRFGIMHPFAYKFYVSRRVWTEIYYTEDIPMWWGNFDRVAALGAGTSRIGGLPNNKNCKECNIHLQREQVDDERWVPPENVWEVDEEDSRSVITLSDSPSRSASGESRDGRWTDEEEPREDGELTEEESEDDLLTERDNGGNNEDPVQSWSSPRIPTQPSTPNGGETAEYYQKLYEQICRGCPNVKVPWLDNNRR